MTREEQKKLKELKNALPKILQKKIKTYKFKKKDYIIWFSNKELFFTLFINVGVTDDNVCICTSNEIVKPLWLDDLLWYFLKMEDNKKESQSLRAIGAFTVTGSQIYENKCELKNWDFNELEKCVESYIEHFYSSIQNANITTFLNNIKFPSYHQELREVLTLVYKKQYIEALEVLRNLDGGYFENGGISINETIREYCKKNTTDKLQADD